MDIDTILKIAGLPSITAVIAAIVTYRYAKRGKVDDKIIGRAIELAENISLLIQDIIEDEEYFYQLYVGNYGHFEDMRAAIQNFERMESLFHGDYQRIEEHMGRRKRLSDELKDARLYLNNKVINMINNYLKIGQFTFQHDSIGMADNYYQRFFENIMDTQKRESRKGKSIVIFENLKKLLK